jgi:hypothetical protein
MPFTLEQIENVANSVLDFHMDKGKKPVYQHIQDKPLLSKLRPKQKSIPGGKGRVDMPVVLETASQLQGFTYDDTVSYGSPAKNRRVSYAYRLFHIGIQTTTHELIHEGISVVDTAQGKNMTDHSERELILLTDIFEGKVADMQEGFDHDLNQMFWLDGTQPAPGGGASFQGVLSVVVDSPSSAVVVGGLDQQANVRWRNRANLTITVSATTQGVLRVLDSEMPQLRRFGGKPNLMLAGSAMIDEIKQEQRQKGVFTQTGWAKDGQDLSVGDAQFDNIPIFYDPTLDDIGYSKRLYVLEIAKPGIFPFVVDGEDEKLHNPARPPEKYAIYRAKTWVGGLACNRRNGCGVYAFP